METRREESSVISSPSNPRIRQVQNLVKKTKARKESGLFVAEGEKMFSELPKERIVSVFVSASFLEQQKNRRLLGGRRYQTVTDEVFRSMSDTVSPQGILALARQFSYTMEDILERPGPALLLLLESIQDPGNLGTMIRAGEGAGVTGIIMSGNTADVYSPKVIRSTMGSVCRVPFLYASDWTGVLSFLRQKNIRLFGTDLKARNNYDREDYNGDIGFVIGNEARGMTGETAKAVDTLVKIPMKGNVESLNASVAASILLFEAARQRRM